MGAKISILELILSCSHYLRSAMGRFPFYFRYPPAVPKVSTPHHLVPWVSWSLPHLIALVTAEKSVHTSTPPQQEPSFPAS